MLVWEAKVRVYRLLGGCGGGGEGEADGEKEGKGGGGGSNCRGGIGTVVFAAR